jgi:hypothetical protein
MDSTNWECCQVSPDLPPPFPLSPFPFPLPSLPFPSLPLPFPSLPLPFISQPPNPITTQCHHRENWVCIPGCEGYVPILLRRVQCGHMKCRKCDRLSGLSERSPREEEQEREREEEKKKKKTNGGKGGLRALFCGGK